jgi:DNA polymerase-3 subunit alpha
MDDLTALMALYRPGPLGSGMIDDFIKARHGQKEVNYLHPSLEPVLKETYGVILYQEQVMRIASEVGGFSLGEADLVRRAMGKKKPEVLMAMRERFIGGAIEKGLLKETATAIFDLMEYFSGYGFNKSHSAAYALVSYQTAYFKVNYPQEYMAALLTSVMGNSDKIGLYIEECRRMGLSIYPPDVNLSMASFAPEEEGIRFGLLSIKNVGIGAIEKIIESRKTGKFHSLYDFCTRVSSQLVNKRVVESLIKSGALDCTGLRRKQMLTELDEILEITNKLNYAANQLSLLDSFDIEDVAPNVKAGNVEEFLQNELLQLEKEHLGVFISGHPLDEWREKFLQNGVMSLAELEEEPDGKEVLIGGVVSGWREVNTKKGSQMARARLEDWTGALEVIIFPKLFMEIKEDYLPDRVVVVKGRLERQDEGVKVLAAQVRWLG